MSSFAFSRVLHVLGLGGILFIASTIWTFWYGMHSDRDDISPFLNRLMPAGHCACETATLFECSNCLNPPRRPFMDSNPSILWEYDYERDSHNHGLTEDQCNVAFPGLYEDVNRGMKYWYSQGNITQQTLDDIPLDNGMTRAMIYEGNLYVVACNQGDNGEDHRQRALAVLSDIHRVLTSFPFRKSLPNIEFMFAYEDKLDDITGPGHPLWMLTRKASEEYLWLMPDFAFWAWNVGTLNRIGLNQASQLGSYEEAVDNAILIEQNLDYAAKEPKLLWRGRLSMGSKIRRNLLDRSRNQPWSAVKELSEDVPENYVALEDHCKYQFIAHAEGRSYSGALKYRQACRSVILIHKLQYIQHHHYLLVSSGPLQNYVQVERDFSDLPEKMANLLDHPAKAQKIADNSVKTFRERYLTPAAEACYWRALWRGYAQVSDPAQLWTDRPDGTRLKRGMPYESFLQLSSEDMKDFVYIR